MQHAETSELQWSNNDRHKRLDPYVTFCRIYRVVCSHRAYRYVSFEGKVHCPAVSRAVVARKISTETVRNSISFFNVRSSSKILSTRLLRKIAASEENNCNDLFSSSFLSLSFHKVYIYILLLCMRKYEEG